MIADPVKNAGGVAERLVAGKGKRVLYDAAQFQPDRCFEPQAAPAYVRAHSRVIPCDLIHFENPQRDSDGVTYLSPPVGSSQFNRQRADNAIAILHATYIGTRGRDFTPFAAKVLLPVLESDKLACIPAAGSDKSGVCNAVFKW